MNNMKARFFTKIVGDEDLTKYNGQIVEIIDSKDYRYETRYTIRFKNGKIVHNIMDTELDFVLDCKRLREAE